MANIHPWPLARTKKAREVEARADRVADEALRLCALRNHAREMGDEETYAEVAGMAEQACRRSSQLYEQWRKLAGVRP